MEISDVRRRVIETIERSRSVAAARRARTEEATREYGQFLDGVAIPLFRQVTNVLRTAGYSFTVITPAGAVRMTSDRSGEDFIELSLNTTGNEPHVLGRTSHLRGRHLVDAEQIVGSGNPAALTEEDVLSFVLKELEPFVER